MLNFYASQETGQAKEKGHSAEQNWFDIMANRKFSSYLTERTTRHHGYNKLITLGVEQEHFIDINSSLKLSDLNENENGSTMFRKTPQY